MRRVLLALVLLSLPVRAQAPVALVVQAGLSAEPNQLQAIDGHGRLLAAAVRGARLAQVWDLRSRRLLRQLPVTEGVSELRWSRSGKLLQVGAGREHSLFDVATGALLLKTDADAAWFVGDDYLFMETFQRKLMLFPPNAPGARPLAIFGGKPAPCEAFTPAPDGKSGLCAFDDGFQRVDLEAQTVGPKLSVDQHKEGFLVFYAPDSARLALVGFEGKLRLLDARTLEPVKDVSYADGGGTGERFAIAATQPSEGDSLWFLARGGRHRLDFKTGAVTTSRWDEFTYGGARPQLRGPAELFAPDGSFALTTLPRTFENSVGYLRDGATGATVGLLQGGHALAPEVRFDAQGRPLAILGGGAEYSSQKQADARIIDLTGPRDLVREHATLVGGLSEDGRLAQVGAQFIDLQTGKRTPNPLVGTLSPSGRLFVGTKPARADLEHMMFADTATGQITSVFQARGEELSNCRFTPDEQLVVCAATVAFKERLRVFEVPSGKLLNELPGRLAALSNTLVLVKHEFREALVLALREPEATAVRFRYAEQPLTGGAFSADGTRAVLAVGGGLGLLDLGTFKMQVIWPKQAYRWADSTFLLDRAGAFMVVGTRDGKLTFVTPAGEAGPELDAHDGPVLGLSQSPDGKKLVSLGADGRSTVWDLATKQPLFSAARTLDELVLVAPEGPFLALRDAGQDVAARVGLRAYPIDSFDLGLNRPDLVLASVGAPEEVVTRWQKAHVARLAKVGRTEEPPMGTFVLADVRLGHVAASTKAETLALPYTITEGAAAAQSLQVRVNGVPLFAGLGKPVAELGGLAGTLAIPLSRGQNLIAVTVTDARLGTSPPETVLVTRQAPPRAPEMWLLAVGVSKYTDTSYALQYAAKDAQDLAGTLQKLGGGFAKVHTKLVLDGDATRENILAGRAFLTQADRDDVVVVFLAGHGLLDREARYFFATTDLDFDQPAARGLSFPELESLVAGLPSRKRLVLIDTCAAGETDTEEVARAESNPRMEKAVVVASRGLKKSAGRASLVADPSSIMLARDLFTDLRQGSGATVIGSSAGVEFAFETASLKNGVFTHALLEALSARPVFWGARANENQLSVSGLQAQVTNSVVAATAGQQHPIARDVNADGDFVVWTFPLRKGKGR
ncbi:MAG: caspase family protein [Deltaproteobacteria bacterium]|nr:caspase family protein [Deltaproteobacteria bacterium]